MKGLCIFNAMRAWRRKERNHHKTGGREPCDLDHSYLLVTIIMTEMESYVSYVHIREFHLVQ